MFLGRCLRTCHEAENCPQQATGLGSNSRGWATTTATTAAAEPHLRRLVSVCWHAQDVGAPRENGNRCKTQLFVLITHPPHKPRFGQSSRTPLLLFPTMGGSTARPALPTATCCCHLSGPPTALSRTSPGECKVQHVHRKRGRKMVCVRLQLSSFVHCMSFSSGLLERTTTNSTAATATSSHPPW